MDNFDIIQIAGWLSSLLTLENFLKFILFYFFVVWISIIVWVFKDITNRTNNIFLQLFSILIVLLFTPIGIFIYLLIRPGKTIFEKYYQEIEDNLDTLSDSIKNSIIACPKCTSQVSLNFAFCPSCNHKLQEKCTHCHKNVFFDWKLCPYCGKKQKTKKDA